MLCFPKSVVQPKKPREELLPLPPCCTLGLKSPTMGLSSPTSYSWYPEYSCSPASGIPLPHILHHSQPVYSGLGLFMAIVICY